MKYFSFLLIYICVSCSRSYDEVKYDSDNVKELRVKWNQYDTLYLISYLDSINRLPMANFVSSLEDVQNVNGIYFPVFNETYQWINMDSLQVLKYRRFAYNATKAFIRNCRYMQKLSESKKDTLLYNRYGTWTYADTSTLNKLVFDIDSLCNEVR